MKKVFLNSIVIFLLCFLFHYLYDIVKLPVLRIFLPINESIFEHIKMLFTANVIFSLFTREKNKYLKALVRGVLSCSILLTIYIPLFLNIGENLSLTLTILFISIFISEVITSRIKKYSKEINYFSIFIILIIYFSLLCLTDKPLSNFLFQDFSR